eukprot:764782-Hanusia_phi.AAC.4
MRGVYRRAYKYSEGGSLCEQIGLQYLCKECRGGGGEICSHRNARLPPLVSESGLSQVSKLARHAEPPNDE